MERFGEKIRLLRKQQNVTQQEISDKVGIGRVHLSDLERGKKMPQAALIIKFAKVFGVTPNDLMLDELEVGDD